MDTLELVYRLSVSLAIGLLMGIERGWKTRDEAEGERSLGLRTFTLSGLLGGILAAIGAASGNASAVVGLSFLGFAPVIAFLRYREMAHDKTYGATTVVAALVAFALGAFAVLGDPRAAAAAGVAATALLALKQALHGWIRTLTWQELRAGLVLLAMTLILLPLLPDRAMGPFDAINPHELWLMTILIAAVSSAGYIAMKWFGGRQGVALSGIAGGLVSSTAVTLSFSRLARENPARARALVAATLLASSTMMLRILLVAGAINLAMLRWLLLPLALAALGTALLAGWHLWRSTGEGADTPLMLKAPFELTTVLKFGAFLAFIMVAAKGLTVWAGGWGAFGLAAISGIADVDAITLTMSRLGGSELDARTAGAAILLAAAVNTVAKAGLAWFAGGRGPALRLAAGAALAIALGVAGFALSTLWDPIATLAELPIAS